MAGDDCSEVEEVPLVVLMGMSNASAAAAVPCTNKDGRDAHFRRVPIV